MNWDGKEGRCDMYCHALSDDDWLAVCDCWEAERVLEGAVDETPAEDA